MAFLIQKKEKSDVMENKMLSRIKKSFNNKNVITFVIALLSTFIYSNDQVPAPPQKTPIALVNGKECDINGNNERLQV